MMVLPCSESCRISSKQVPCRAEIVDAVNRIVDERSIEIVDSRRFDETKVRVDDPLIPAEIRKDLINMLQKYQHCFASSFREVGCTSVTEMKIDLDSQRPVVHRPYRLSQHKRENVRWMVGDLSDV